jgi:HK97 family phage prohead protease
MDKLIRKTFNGEVVEVKDNQATIYVTTYDIDRYSEVILPSAWQKRISNYLAHPILLSSHDYNSLRNQIGKAISITIDEKGMKSTFEYFTKAGNPEADWGYFLVSQKQAAYSVGFIDKASTDTKEEIAKLLVPYNFVQAQIDEVKRVYTDVELLEVSQVTVPANPQTIQGDSYYGFIKSFITKPEPEIGDKYIIIRVEDPDKFVDDSFRTITISAEKGIKATIGKYKSDPDGPTHIQRYLFDKDKWTLAEAEAWVRDHKSLSSEDIIKEYEKLELEQKLINSSLEEKAKWIKMLKAIVDKNKF